MTPSAQPEVSATDAAFLKMWKLDGREVRNLMALNDVVGEDHVTETLMHIIHLKHLVDGVQSGMMIGLLLFLQKQNLAYAVYHFGSVLSLPD